MNSSVLKKKCALVLVIGGLLAAGPVLSGQPEWAGGKGKGKGHSDERSDRRDDDRGRRDDDRGQRDADRRSDSKHRHFEDRHAVIVREYYTENYRGGRCPPGLAKKRNGCMPPGQAKKWKMGRPLPRDVIYYEVPQPLVLRIGPPPSGYRYVRVASDILMIAIGTGMVVDAIQNLGR